MMKLFKSVWFHVFLACSLLLLSGYVYKKAALRLDALVKKPIPPTAPLSTFPYEAGSWRGQDQPLRETVLQVAGNDDYINRSYHNQELDYYVNLYVAFTSQPRNMLGHRPQVCYPGAGWVPDNIEKQDLELDSGKIIPVLIHTFHKPTPEQTRVVVLNYYIINGTVTSDHRDFSGIQWRLLTLSRKRVRYVAQVQISASSATAVLAFAKEIAPLLQPFMPVENKDGV